MISGSTKNKLVGVVLAAGFSSRMGKWKMELSIKGRPVIYYTIRPMLEVCESVIVVGGYSIERLSALLEKICLPGELQREKIKLVKNENFQKGMFSSVKKGLAAADGNSNGIFVMPGDMPFVSQDTYKKLADFMNQETGGKDVIFPTTLLSIEVDGMRWKKGHPVLLSNRVRELIMQNDDDAVFREVLWPFSFDLCPVCDEGICLDIDDDLDFEKALSYMEKNYKYS